MKEQLERATGERVSALEGIGQAALESSKEAVDKAKESEGRAAPATDVEREPARDGGIEAEESIEPHLPEREPQIEMELEL